MLSASSGGTARSSGMRCSPAAPRGSGRPKASRGRALRGRPGSGSRLARPAWAGHRSGSGSASQSHSSESKRSGCSSCGKCPAPVDQPPPVRRRRRSGPSPARSRAARSCPGPRAGAGWAPGSAPACGGRTAARRAAAGTGRTSGDTPAPSAPPRGWTWRRGSCVRSPGPASPARTRPAASARPAARRSGAAPFWQQRQLEAQRVPAAPALADRVGEQGGPHPQRVRPPRRRRGA